MKKSNFIEKCNTCGLFRGFIINQKDGSVVARGFCLCEHQGWEPCKIHSRHVKYRHTVSKIKDLEGNYARFTAYSMMAPCRVNTCFKVSQEFHEKVSEFIGELRGVATE